MSSTPLGGGDVPVRRWQAPEVGGERSTAPEPRRGGLMTAEQLAAIEAQAHEEGYRAGYDEGRQAGLDAGAEEMKKRAAEMAALADSMSAQLKVLDDVLLEQIAALVVAVARHFVRRELKSDPGEIVRVVREALGALPASDARARVHLHPDDAALVQNVLSTDLCERPLQIVEDVTLSRGGARVETDSSLVDASFERRMNTIVARLLGDERASVDVPREPPADE